MTAAFVARALAPGKRGTQPQRKKRRRAKRSRKELREFLFVEQQGICYLRISASCEVRGGEMHLGGGTRGGFATLEHVIPRSRKAKGERSLLLLACSKCNQEKGSKLPLMHEIELAERLYRKFNSNVTDEDRAAEKHRQFDCAMRRAAIPIPGATARERYRAVRSLHGAASNALGR